jgi:hypothetical protein
MEVRKSEFFGRRIGKSELPTGYHEKNRCFSGKNKELSPL